MKRSIKTVCDHEAAHAVIAEKMGVPVKKIIYDPVKVAGDVELDVDHGDDEYAYGIAVSAQAGIIMDEMNGVDDGYSKNDDIALSRSIRDLSKGDFDKMVALPSEIHEKAKDHINNNLAEIKNLSSELQIKHEIKR